MMNKKAYLYSIRDRISCESDAEREWDAYRGSALLLQACWDLYSKTGRRLHVAPEVAGMMLMNGTTLLQANASIYQG